MSDTGKQSPLGVNVLASILQNIGLTINKVTQSYVGQSKEYGQYTFGSVCSTTVLNKLTQSIRLAYESGDITESTYNDLFFVPIFSEASVMNIVKVLFPSYASINVE